MNTAVDRLDGMAAASAVPIVAAAEGRAAAAAAGGTTAAVETAAGVAEHAAHIPLSSLMESLHDPQAVHSSLCPSPVCYSKAYDPKLSIPRQRLCYKNQYGQHLTKSSNMNTMNLRWHVRRPYIFEYC